MCDVTDFLFLTGDFRPVELNEFVCSEGRIAKVNTGQFIKEVPKTCGNVLYNTEMDKIDPDRLSALVFEVVPEDSCLVFCATKNNCENVAMLLINVIKMAGLTGPKRVMLEYCREEKLDIIATLKADGFLCEVTHFE